MRRVVVDTNVLVSGLLSPHGPPGRIVDGLTSGALTLVYDDRVMGEYHEVLRRPRFGFAQRDIDVLLGHLASAHEPVVAPPLSLDLEDPDDAPFIEVAAAARPDALVTGNGRHFEVAAVLCLRVLAPADFVRAWARKDG